MTQKPNLLREIRSLRQDLHDLKNCQLQYFTISISGTGAILGLSIILGATAYKGLAFLAPLTVILPCWLIFFDKATTITRIVGYQRLLEDQISGKAHSFGRSYNYYGWENSLSIFRSKENEAWSYVKKFMGRRSIFSFLGMFSLKTRHRFWMINWYTFFLLSSICCLCGYLILCDQKFNFLSLCDPASIIPASAWAEIVALFLFLVCTIYTLILLYFLKIGSLSYEGCSLIWRYILTTDLKNEFD
jgi:hypothetical protein